MTILTIILIIALPTIGILGYAFRAYLGKIKLSSAEAKSQRIVQDAIKDAELVGKQPAKTPDTTPVGPATLPKTSVAQAPPTPTNS